MAAPDRARAALERVVAAMGAGEDRPGQTQMAEAVASAIAHRRHLAVRAGTGTGKSLAYLVPAVISSKPVVIATATKALQDQLTDNDLPAVRDALERPIDWAVLKGRSNYVCRQRLAERDTAAQRLELEDEDDRLSDEIDEITAWADQTPTGDRAELDVEPSPAAWARVSMAARECPGAANCASGESCFAEAARQRAQEAKIVIVNTHLLGLDLGAEGALLPDHEVVIVDEAHTLDEVVSATCGVEVTGGRIANLGRLVDGLIAGTGLGASLASAGARLAEAADGEHGDDRRLRAGREPELEDALVLARELASQVLTEAQALDVGSTQDAADRKARLVTVATGLADDLARLIDPAGDEVRFIQQDRTGPRLRLAPLDVAPLLGERLFEESTVILTSATLPDGTAARLGAPSDDTDEIDVGSPFDYSTNALLYCATHLPDVRASNADEARHAELASLIAAAGGRTLGLFSSFRAMNAAVEALEDSLPGELLVQGQLPKRRLVERFHNEPTTSLFATMGFWQGIDVPGPSCTLVTIDRIPFPRPDDPLLQARREQARGGAFGEVDLPRASVMLAQGVGRLIRTRTDAGVVAILDRRLALSKNYRWELIRALPPMSRTRDGEEVRARLAYLDAEATAAGN